MSQIKLELALDANKPNEVKAFADFLYAIVGESAKTTEESPEVKSEKPTENEKITETDKPKQTRSRSKAAAPEKEEAEPTEDVETSDSDTEAQDNSEDGDSVAKDSKAATGSSAGKTAETTVSLDEIRSNLSKKIDDHRDAIREAMAKTGAKNITTLAEEDYESFNEFLKGLK